MNVDQIIIDTYKEGYAVSSIKRILWDKHHHGISDDKIKRILNDSKLEIRPQSYRGKVYNQRRGRFAHLK